jgi:NADH-quinone oxidoreductase subunit J
VSPIAFCPLALGTVGAALVVVAHRNPVYNALGLVVTMVFLSAFFAGLDAPVLWALQLIVYAGAILVLFLFVVMLLNLGEDRRISGGPRRVVAAAMAAGALAGLAMAGTVGWRPGMSPADPRLSDPAWLGEVLFTRHLLAFELTSLLLLVAIVGAVVLGRRRP